MRLTPGPGRRPGPGPEQPPHHASRTPPKACCRPWPGTRRSSCWPGCRPWWSGTAAPEPQDAALATLAPKLDQGHGAAWTPSAPPAELHRQVRALQPWPGAELTVAGTLVKVCAVGGLRPDPGAAGTLAWNRQGAWLTAGDGMALELTLLQRPGKPVQPAAQALQPWGAAGKPSNSEGLDRLVDLFGQGVVLAR